MYSVALIGPDGAGKSTLVRRLLDELPLPTAYLYMGINVESSNVALPTSRLAQAFKTLRNSNAAEGNSGSRNLKKRRPKPFVWRAVRTMNRLAEEWYRQLLAWKYQRSGRVVLYDRHFRFDFAGDEQQRLPATERFHRWCLAHLYPSPDLILFLDAPAEVLYARKGEASIEWLEARRQAMLQMADHTRNFKRIDANRPVDEVFEEVQQHIMDYDRKTRNSAN